MKESTSARRPIMHRYFQRRAIDKRPVLARRLLWATAVSCVLIVFGCVVCMILRQQKFITCDRLFSRQLNPHLTHGVFKQLVGEYSEVWVSKKFLSHSECSFFTMKTDGSFMEGYRNTSGLFTKYGRLSDGRGGVINMYEEDGMRTELGKLYPLFFNEFVLGSVICKEEKESVVWRSSVAVQHYLLHHPKTPSLVTDGVVALTRLGPQVSDGDFYVLPCFEDPVWRDYTKY